MMHVVISWFKRRRLQKRGEANNDGGPIQIRRAKKYGQMNGFGEGEMSCYCWCHFRILESDFLALIWIGAKKKYDLIKRERNAEAKLKSETVFNINASANIAHILPHMLKCATHPFSPAALWSKNIPSGFAAESRRRLWMGSPSMQLHPRIAVKQLLSSSSFLRETEGTVWGGGGGIFVGNDYPTNTPPDKSSFWTKTAQV